MSGTPLTTLTQVLRPLRDLRNGEEDEVLLQDWIYAASALVRTETGREFALPPEVREESIELFGAERVYLQEVIDKSSVEWVVDEYGQPINFRVTQPPSEQLKGCWLHLDHQYKGQGIYGEDIPTEHRDLFIRNIRVGERVSAFGKYIVVKARWGYPTIPHDINNLTARAVRRWYYALGNQIETITLEESGTPGQHLPPAVIAGLQKWTAPARRVLVH